MKLSGTDIPEPWKHLKTHCATSSIRLAIRLLSWMTVQELFGENFRRCLADEMLTGSSQPPLNVIGDVMRVVADAEENSRPEGVHPVQPEDVKTP